MGLLPVFKGHLMDRLCYKDIDYSEYTLAFQLQSNAYERPRLLSGLPLKRPLKFPPVKKYYIKMSR